MTEAQGQVHEPGWYPDPWRQASFRWFDGTQWTPAISGPAASPAAAVAAKAPREPAAEPVTDPATRRRQGIELLIVLAIFPLPYFFTAMQSLVETIVDPHTTQSRYPDVIPGHPGYSLPFNLVFTAATLAAPALVLFLLSSSGEGARSIGLRRGRVRGDLALVLPVFGVAYLVPFLGVGLLLRAAGVLGSSLKIGQTSNLYVIAAVVSAICAGVVEEIVVLGYLVRRLEQRGWPTAAVVVVAVVVRTSYHLYYGWGVLPIVAWALVSVLLYRRVRRLVPFIVVHALWDTTTLLTALFGSSAVIGAIPLVLTPVTILLTAVWWKELEAGR
ncbi:MAG TPA: CPBP family glutamic-type intramembrane protease [Acidimicrobiales bacterium]|nr:CPBP family glutamic-type intramembrane protease [Acidimicrobiales bacterium]